VEFRVLGPLEVEEDGQALPLGGAKQRALLATLLVRANRVVSVDALLDELWGEQPPDSAANMVQGYVSRLRKVFASYGHDVIVHSPPGYVLKVEPERIDSHRFEHLLRESTEARSDGDLEAAGARLREALSLWRGAALSDVEVNSFVEIELGRLEELRLSAIEERIDIDLALGRHAEIVAELEALVAEHPLRERLRRELMLALYRCDRQAEALSVYRSGRHHLVEELGIEPGAPLRELERAILVHDPSVETPVVVPPTDAPTTGIVRSRRRRGLLTAAATLAIGGAGAVAVVGFRGADSSTVTVPKNSVGVIDPATSRVTDAVVGIGPAPGGLAVANGAVWVANRGDQTVARVSARTHDLERTIPVHGTPTGIAAADGAVWVTHGFQGTLERIDTRYDQVAQRIGVLSARAAQTSTIAGTVALGPTAMRTAWAAYSDSTVVRVDTSGDRSRISAHGYAGYTPAGIAVGMGAVWVTNYNANTVSRLDPSNLDPAGPHPINVGKGPIGLAVGGGAVWVADSFENKVSRIDPLTDASTSTPVGKHPVAVVFGYGSVWVANNKSGTVSRIDPRTGKLVGTIKVGGDPAGIAVGAGRVWVTVDRG
jgi:YVTN family beta-propeller protein